MHCGADAFFAVLGSPMMGIDGIGELGLHARVIR